MNETQNDVIENTYDPCTTVSLMVFFKKEEVDGQSCHRVEEGENPDSDKELSRGRVVTFEEQTLRLGTFT